MSDIVTLLLLESVLHSYEYIYIVNDLVYIVVTAITNDRFKSVEHRALANHVGPRVSIASFFSTSFQPSTKHYGPIKELYHKTILQSIRKLEFMIMLSSPWQEALMELLLCRISGFEISD